MSIKKYLPITRWDTDDKPREKLDRLGPKSLSNAELLAIILQNGYKGVSALSLGKQLLAHFDNNLTLMFKSSIHSYQKVKGVGKAKASILKASLELGKRSYTFLSQAPNYVNSSESAYKTFKASLEDLTREEFWVAYLNNAHQLIKLEQLSKGGMTSTVVDVRILLKRCIELEAVALVVAHNHPSGKLQPSKADKNLTQKILIAAKTMDIALLDHIIITPTNYFSFADHSLL
jgi:DNA repair protein RadC